MKDCEGKALGRVIGIWVLACYLLLIGSSFSAVAQTCTPLPANIVAWWRSENSSVDLISSKPGILAGNESFGTGKVGLGFSGDGFGDGVLITNTAPLALQTLTIEGWIRRGSNGTVSGTPGAGACLVGFGSGGYFFWINSSGQLAFNRLGDGANYSSGKILDTSFHHVAVTVGSGQVTFYIDGALAGSGGFNTTFSFSGGMGIGYRPDNADNSFLGTIDEVSIYGRALDPVEVMATYVAGAEGKCATHGPEILKQPDSQTHIIGRSAIFSVIGSGNEPLYYKWLFNGTNIPGATNRTLTLSALEMGQSGSYSVVISNAFGSSLSSNALLTLTTANCRTPDSGMVGWWGAEGDAQDLVGDGVGTFAGNEFIGTGAVGFGFVGDGIGDGVLVTNAGALQLSIFTVEGWIRRGSPSMVSFGGGGNGVLMGFGPGGYIFYMDPGGHLNFGKLGDATVTSAITITDQNFHHLAASLDGALLRLYVDGTNVTTVSYNVTFGFPSTFGIGIRPDNLDNSFWGTIDEVSVYKRALTSAEVQGIYESGDSGKCVGGAPVIMVQPTNQTVYEGMSASFLVTSRSAGLTYQWRFNGTNLSGATDSELKLISAQLSQMGTYSVLVSNTYGFVSSSNVFLTVIPAPLCRTVPSGIVGWWRGQSNTFDYAGDGGGILFGNETYGAGEVGAGFAGDGAGDGVLVTNTLALQVQTLTVEGWVKRGSLGTISQGSGWNGALFGFGPGGHLTYMDSAGHVVFTQLGGGAILSSTRTLTDTNFHHIAVSVGSGAVRLYIDGTNTDTVATSLAFTYTSPFGIGIRPDNKDNSFLGVIDEVSVYGRVLTGAEIKSIYDAAVSGKCHVLSQPVVTQQPVSQYAGAGTTVTLAVAVTGDPPLKFQWYFNQAVIPNATNSVLLLGNIQAHNAGAYSVVVTNAFGSVTSSNADVGVRLVTVSANGQVQTNANNLYSGVVTLQLNNYYSGGFIFYTLDGTEPTAFSPIYFGPIVVSNSVVLRTLAFSGDFSEFAGSPPMTFMILPQYSLSVSTPGGGSVVMDPNATGHFSNTLVTVTATPSNGWTFLQWSGDLEGANPTRSVRMDRNKSVQAIFGTAVGKATVGGGNISFNPPGTVFPFGFTLTAGALPNPGNGFVFWGNSASGNTNPLLFKVVVPNPSLSALFASKPTNQFSLTVLPTGHGTVTVNPRANVFPAGQTVTLAAEADAGRTFDGWSGEATGNQTNLSVTMTNDKVIYANFSTDGQLFANLKGRSLVDGIQLNLIGETGVRYRLDQSTNFTDWATLMDATNFTGSMQYLDVGTSNAPQKFYRALVVP